MTRPKNNWLDRALTVSSWHYTLVLSEAEFNAEMLRMEIPTYAQRQFLGNGDHASTHLIPAGLNSTGSNCAVVCLDGKLAKSKTPVQVAALLVHEAVHIWQAHARTIGALNDHGDEEEAYAIQWLSQSLMQEYARRLEEDACHV